MHGELDDLIPVCNAHVLAGHLPDARLEILPDAGHYFFREEPLHAAELVRDHAGACTRSRAVEGWASRSGRELTVRTDDGVLLAGEETWNAPHPDPTHPGPAGDPAGAAGDSARPPIVLLHGLTATRRYVVMGSRLLERSGYRVVAYDARGHGRSAPAPSPDAYGYARLARDLEVVLDALALPRAALAGASMGAHTPFASRSRTPSG